MTEPLTDEELWGFELMAQPDLRDYCVLKQQICMCAPVGECVYPATDRPCERIQEAAQ